ncbi:MAG: MFS transporter [Verrucomicrobiota bacterium]
MPASPDAPDLPDHDSDEFRPDWRSMGGVLIVQAHNVFNDKISQFMLISLAVTLATGMMLSDGAEIVGPAKESIEQSTEYIALMNYEFVISFLVALPFVLFAPIAGWISDRFSKRNVLIWCLVIQLVVLTWITICLRQELLWWATVGFFFLAFQSTLLSPAKFGICKELVGSKKLAVAAGWMQMLVVLSIIIGTVIGGKWFASLKQTHSEWDAASLIIFVLLLASLFQILVMQFVRKTPVQSRDPLTGKRLFEHFEHLGELFRHRELRLAGIGVSYFWFAGGAVALMLIDVGKEWQAAGRGDAGEFFALLNGIVGLGIVLGSLFVSIVSRRGVELGLVPLGALGIAVSCLGAALTGSASVYYFWVCSLGFFAGMFLVPLNAFIQDTALPEHRGRITSAVNLLNAIAGMLAIGFVKLLRDAGLNSSWQFGILALLTIGAGIYILRLMPRHFLRFIVLGLLRMIYRVTPLNTDRIPKTGGVLMISNHVSYIDAFMISAACPRPVRFVIERDFLKFRAFSWFLRVFDVIPISSTRAKEAIRTTSDAVKEGSVVCIFPEGMLTRTGMLNQLKKGFELITRQAKAPIVPVYMDSLWGSIFSFERFRYFYKVPKRIRYPVTVNFGYLIPYEEVESAHVRSVVQDLSAEAFGERQDLKMSLGEAVVRGLKRRKREKLFVEIGKRRRELSRNTVFATASGLAKKWNSTWSDDQKRVAILLPAGAVTSLFNIALVLAKRVPVNLPLGYITQPDRCERMLKKQGIDLVISSKTLFPDRPMPEHFLDMGTEISRVNPLTKIFSRILSPLEPSCCLVRRFRLHRENLESEAIGFVTNDDQFVTLSHRNILASVFQIDSSLVFLPHDQIYLERTLNSVAASVLGLWHPTIQRGSTVFRGLGSRDTPVRSILLESQPQIILLDPTLTRNLLADSDDEISESIKVFLNHQHNSISKSEVELLESAGGEYCEMFAPDTLGAIVSMNTKDPTSMVPSHLPQVGNREGTVGRLLPGVSARLMGSENGDPKLQKLWDHGELLVRGISFPKNEHRIEVEEREWVRTNARGTFDRDGFLTLQERKPE